METYRSGHNEPDSKSGSPQGLVGSNPTVSATKALKTLRFQGFFLASCGALFRWIFLNGARGTLICGAPQRLPYAIHSAKMYAVVP